MTTLPPADAYPKGNTLIVPVAVGAIVPTPTFISKVLSVSVFLTIKSPRYSDCSDPAIFTLLLTLNPWFWVVVTTAIPVSLS